MRTTKEQKLWKKITLIRYLSQNKHKFTVTFRKLVIFSLFFSHYPLKKIESGI